MKTLKNYIGGKWVAASRRETVDNINPATGGLICRAPRSARADTRKAISAAATAFKKWRLVPAPRRGEILYKAARLLEEHKEELARALTAEMGKVLVEARGDVQEAIDVAYYMAGEGRRWFGQTTPSEMPDKSAMSVRCPYGVAGIITPWNFPVAIPAWKTMPALVCGNTVVLKPATDTPLTAFMFVRILEQAGIPPGVINLVFGPGGEIGKELCTSEAVKVIGFTGSTETGRDIDMAAAPYNKIVSKEMGGKNAIIVMEDAALDLAVDGIIWSAFGTSGQRCTAASRVIVHTKVVKKLAEKLLKRTKALRLGDGLNRNTDIGPVINRNALEKIHSFVEIGVKEGAKLLCGGEIATRGALRRGSFYKPTIFANVHPKMRIAQEEIFGPVTDIIAVRSLEEAIRVSNEVRYGLSSSIFTADVNRAFAAMRDLDAGLVYINHGTIGAEVHLPFGGWRASGNGHRDSGTPVLDIYSQWKTIYVDFSGRLQRAQID